MCVLTKIWDSAAKCFRFCNVNLDLAMHHTSNYNFAVFIHPPQYTVISILYDILVYAFKSKGCY